VPIAAVITSVTGADWETPCAPTTAPGPAQSEREIVKVMGRSAAVTQSTVNDRVSVDGMLVAPAAP